MGLSFSQAEIFPLIARLIVQASACGNGFVEHPTIVSLLSADAEGSTIVHRAATSSGFPDPGHVAANMVAWFSQRISVNDSPWAAFFDRKRRSNGWAYRPVTAAHPSILSECDRVAIEGNLQMYFHLRRERDPTIAKAKRDAFVAIHGTLHCECCRFDTNSMFSGLGYDVCEIHHRVPLALASEPVKTTLNDLAVLCPNCHRAIHKTHPLMSVEEFCLHFFGASCNAEIG